MGSVEVPASIINWERATTADSYAAALTSSVTEDLCTLLSGQSCKYEKEIRIGTKMLPPPVPDAAAKADALVSTNQSCACKGKKRIGESFVNWLTLMAKKRTVLPRQQHQKTLGSGH